MFIYLQAVMREIKNKLFPRRPTISKSTSKACENEFKWIVIFVFDFKIKFLCLLRKLIEIFMKNIRIQNNKHLITFFNIRL